jgi:hypothetical protein
MPAAPLRVMDLANMRSLGIRSVALACSCGRGAEVSVDAYPDSYLVPDMKHYFRCSSCGNRPYSSRPNVRAMRRENSSPDIRADAPEPPYWPSEDGPLPPVPAPRRFP